MVSLYVCMLSRFSHVRLYLRDPMDCTAPGSSVHGILQARTLEWAAMPPSRPSRPRGTHAACVSWAGRHALHCRAAGKPETGTLYTLTVKHLHDAEIDRAKGDRHPGRFPFHSHAWVCSGTVKHPQTSAHAFPCMWDLALHMSLHSITGFFFLSDTS